MPLMPIYETPDTGRPAKGHRKHLYPLGGRLINRTDQVSCDDITYLRMWRGFLYLMAIKEWFTPKVLAWRISNLRSRLLRRGKRCHPALRLARDHEHGKGSQFTFFVWIDRLKRLDNRISMEGYS